MHQYLDLVQHVLDHGTRKENRTGVDTLSTFGHYYEHDLRDGFPLLTTKSVSWKNIVCEMLWFLSGQTDVGILKQHGCKFWDAWADGNGKVPSAYGNFWRQFPVHGTRSSSDHNIDGDDCLAFNDQIAWVLAELKRNPMSRRMVVSAWAPSNAQTSKLPPCHCLFMFNVQNHKPKVVHYGTNDGTMPACVADRYERTTRGHILPRGEGFNEDLNWCPECQKVMPRLQNLESKDPQRLCLHLTQRSCDVALGVPYNIASYALLLSLFSHFTGIQPGIFAHTLVDAHIYCAKPDGSMADLDHVPGLKEQLTRTPRKLPKLRISDEIKSLDDIEKLMKPEVTTAEVMRHFVLEGYEPHPAINFKVAV